MLDQEWQCNIASSVAHQAMIIGQEWMIAAAEHQRPSAVYRPTLSVDGNQYCALYGPDLVQGVAGFGKTAAEAMADFDENWRKLAPSRLG